MVFACERAISANSWRDKIRRVIFPWHPCELPEASAKYKDVFICRVSCELSFIDRIRILVAGCVEIESRTITENEIGEHLTESICRPGHGKKNIQQWKACRLYQKLAQS